MTSSLLRDESSAPELDIKKFRVVVRNAVEQLRRQNDLLQVRGFEVPPILFQAFQALDSALAKCEVVIHERDAEMLLLQSLTQTYALINSSLDVDIVLSQSLDELLRLTEGRRGFILLINEETGELNFRVMRGVQPNDDLNSLVSYTILQEVIESKKPLLTENAISDPRMFDYETVVRLGLRSVMCAPLFMRETVRGAIYVDNQLQEGAFDATELDLLVAFAAQTAVALENAILYTQIQEVLREILQVRDLTERVFESIDYGIITASTAGDIMTMNHAAASIFALSPEASIGQPLEQVLPLSSSLFDRVNNVHQQYAQSQSPIINEETVFIPSRGNVVLSFKLTPLQNVYIDMKKDTTGEIDPVTVQGVAMVIEDLTLTRERENTLRMMQRYLPVGMVENIYTIATLGLGGERREVSCIFISVIPYIFLSQTLRPQEQMRLLNHLMQQASEHIHQWEGVVDKYYGTEIMVLMNTQLNPSTNHAARAVMLASAIRERLHKIYRELAIAEEDLFTIAVHTGVATLGNVGSIERRNFTAIGDNINLSKRIHDLTQNGQVLISGETFDHLQQYPLPTELMTNVAFQELPSLTVRGRQQSTRLYEIISND